MTIRMNLREILVMSILRDAKKTMTIADIREVLFKNETPMSAATVSRYLTDFRKLKLVESEYHTDGFARSLHHTITDKGRQELPLSIEWLKQYNERKKK